MNNNTRKSPKRLKKEKTMNEQIKKEKTIKESREQELAEEELKRITRKKTIIWTKRGNHSIKTILKTLRKEKNTIIIQDQGGWITYEQFAKKNHYEIIKLKTNYGIIASEELKKIINKTKQETKPEETILLINSMPSYAFYQPMKTIKKICEQNNILLINDTTGSIGEEEATMGNLIIGSFGKQKPIPLGKGGFIAFNEEDSLIKETTKKQLTELEQESIKEIINFEELNKQLITLKERKKEIIRTSNEFKEKLPKKIKEKIINPDKRGYNIIIAYETEEEKERLINKAKNNNLEITMCPRSIRVSRKAISYEIKRKFGGVK